jgi:predicted signal transduction protein with EAL and GGDEF domain
MAGHEVLDVTAGVGAAMFPWESGATDALLDSADEALRTARATRTGSQ